MKNSLLNYTSKLKIEVRFKCIFPKLPESSFRWRILVRKYLRLEEVCLAMGSEKITVCLYNILSFFDMFIQLILLQTSKNLSVTEQYILVMIMQIYLMVSFKSY